MRLYLASTSPRRIKILKSLKLKFSIIKPSFIEPAVKNNARPKRLALTLALLKALSASRQVKNGVVIGMDTIVMINNNILGKPENSTAAQRMIKLLSNKTHQVITGVAIIRLPEYKIFADVEKTLVTFRRLTNQEIDEYIKTREPYDKAGAYAIQGTAGMFIKKISGCYLNVIGLPVSLFLKLLKKAGWHPVISG